MQTALALAPLVAVLVPMVFFRLSAMAAGLLGFSVALLAASIGFDLTYGETVSRPLSIVGPLAESLFTSATILWIIWPALALFELQSRTGALMRLRDALCTFTQNPACQVLLIAWFFGLAMEGAAGFGTPVALAAPLLVGIGLPPVRAVAVALLGHAPGVSFGAIGTPIFAQLEATGLSPSDVAIATAAVHVVPACVLAVLLLRIARGGEFNRSDCGWGLLAALCFVVPMVLFAAIAGPEIPTLGGAMVGGATFAAILARRRTRSEADPAVSGRGRDLAPYALVVGLVLATRTIAPIREALCSVSWEWTLSDGLYAGRFLPLYHPGTLLLLGLIGSARYTGGATHVLPSLKAALRRLAPVSLALLGMLSLARILVHAGMIDTLAHAAAGAAAAWPLLSPFVGVLGTFVTGSATASNILFALFQSETARALGLPQVTMAAGQGLGAAIGNAVAPHNLVAGSATVGTSTKEGEVLSHTALPVAVYALLGGLMLVAWTWLAVVG